MPNKYVHKRKKNNTWIQWYLYRFTETAFLIRVWAHEVPKTWQIRDLSDLVVLKKSLPRNSLVVWHFPTALFPRARTLLPRDQSAHSERPHTCDPASTSQHAHTDPGSATLRLQHRSAPSAGLGSVRNTQWPAFLHSGGRNRFSEGFFVLANEKQSSKSQTPSILSVSGPRRHDALNRNDFYRLFLSSSPC